MNQILIYACWIVATIATLGSLYFSNIMLFPPCSLCWWQRIFMYPLVVLFIIGFIKKDQNITFYTLPLVLIGWCISVYHNLLYYKFIKAPLIPCSTGSSCTSIQIEWGGFITIPLMALTAFSMILIVLLYSILKGKKYE